MAPRLGLLIMYEEPTLFIAAWHQWHQVVIFQSLREAWQGVFELFNSNISVTGTIY